MLSAIILTPSDGPSPQASPKPTSASYHAQDSQPTDTSSEVSVEAITSAPDVSPNAVGKDVTRPYLQTPSATSPTLSTASPAPYMFLFDGLHPTSSDIEPLPASSQTPPVISSSISKEDAPPPRASNTDAISKPKASPPPLLPSAKVTSTSSTATKSSSSSSKRPSDIPIIHSATYSNVPVYEIIVRGVSIMRRKADAFLNATQILKLANVEKSKRTRFIDKEVCLGQFEKVQGGYGKYQGTWVPMDRGIWIAKTFKVYELMKPIIDFMPSKNEQLPILKKEAFPRDKKRKLNGDSRDGSASPQVSKRQREHSQQHQKRADGKENSKSSSTTASNSPLKTASNTPSKSPVVDNSPTKLDDVTERYEKLLASSFLVKSSDHVPEFLDNDHPLPPTFEIDFPIDEQGHTALHWAASMGRLRLFKALLDKGASPLRTNHRGESVLMSAVSSINTHKAQTFQEILTLAQEAIPIIDKRAQTLLHHVVLNTHVISERVSKSYMAEIVHYIGSRGWECEEFLEARDEQGRTALGIASRNGYTKVVDLITKFKGSITRAKKKAAVAAAKPSVVQPAPTAFNFKERGVLQPSYEANLKVGAGCVDLLQMNSNLSAQAPLEAKSESKDVAGYVDDMPSSPGNVWDLFPTIVLPASVESLEPDASPEMTAADGLDSAPEESPLDDVEESPKPLTLEDVVGPGKSKVSGMLVQQMVDEVNTSFTSKLHLQEEKLTKTRELLRVANEKLTALLTENRLLMIQSQQLPELKLKMEALERLAELKRQEQQAARGMVGAGEDQKREEEEEVTELEGLKSKIEVHTVGLSASAERESRLREEIEALKKVAATKEVVYTKIMESLSAAQGVSGDGGVKM
ncbi:hypothetical protein HDV05_002369 [Chytridiales sp. JEL 0842]|nr:hypothetical protein HDV05_002369 [Chytridiales sp. JEL 0842]